MSGTTISTTITAGITLSSTTQNPVTITPGGAIDTTGSTAIYGVSLTTPWSIDNAGTLSAAGTGILLAGAGDIVNGSIQDQTARIVGGTVGIRAPGYLTKSGTMTSGLLQNYGTIFGSSDGVLMGGTVMNGAAQDTKAIISGGMFGVLLYGAQASLTNFGTIAASGYAAVSEHGASSTGLIVNGSALDTNALIEGHLVGIAAAGLSTVVNYGSIVVPAQTGGSVYGIALDDGGTIINRGIVDAYGGLFVDGGSGAASLQQVVVQNAGTIISAQKNEAAVEIYLNGTESGRLIVDPGSVIDGFVRFNHGTASSAILELASGSSAGTIAGIGLQYTLLNTISFDAGAEWTVSGNSSGLAAGQVISGLAAGDTIILDGVDATKLSISGTSVELAAGTLHYALDLVGAATAPLLLEASASASTISEAVAGGTIQAGEFEFVGRGASETGDTIAGGTLDLRAGATAIGAIDFSGTGGALVIGGKQMPENEIVGFGAHDRIRLAGVKYVAGATVTVAKTGLVTIEDGGKSYDLDIAGATKGEAGFTFGPGSVLTIKGGKMAFLTPPADTGSAMNMVAPTATDGPDMPAPMAPGWAPSAASIEGPAQVLLNVTPTAGLAGWLDMRFDI